MSKANKDDLGKNDTPDLEKNNEPGGDNSPVVPPADPPPVKKDPPVNNTELLTIEEHRKNLNIGSPVFAAVMQAQNWAAGKKIPEAQFKEAVEAFLGAPMGGK